MSELNIGGWINFEKIAEQKADDGRALLCTGNFDIACTYCEKYWNCPFRSEESED